MKRLMLLAVLTAAGLAVAACEEPVQQRTETAPPPAETVAPAAEDAGVPAADTTAPTDVPPVTALPPENRSSEETVQPESETLFY